MTFSKSRKNKVRAALLDWGKANLRQYPWRDCVILPNPGTEFSAKRAATLRAASDFEAGT